MATTADYLNELIVLKAQLVSALNDLGITSTNTEKYNTLIQKVDDITAKAAATFTPTTSDQTISSGQYLTGNQTIKGDANLIASNIKKDVYIFNVKGTYEGASISLTGDATAADVRLNKTFYSNSTTKQTGSMTDSDIKNNSYIQIDDTYDYGIDFTAGYTAAHSIKGFNVPQDATMYVNDMGQQSTLYVYSGDGDVYVGERGDDPSDCVLIASAGTVRKTNMALDQYASGTCVYTVTPGTANTLVKVGTGFIEQQYVQVNGDTNLKASNIKKDVKIFDVTGTYAETFVTYYTGTSAPSSSLGQDGDIYLQTAS